MASMSLGQCLSRGTPGKYHPRLPTRITFGGMTGALPTSGASTRGCLNGSNGKISSARGAHSTPWPGTKPSCFRCWKCQGPGRSSFLTSYIRITSRIQSMTPRSTAPCNNTVKRRSVYNNDTSACRGSVAPFNVRGKVRTSGLCTIMPDRATTTRVNTCAVFVMGGASGPGGEGHPRRPLQGHDLIVSMGYSLWHNSTGGGLVDLSDEAVRRYERQHRQTRR